MDPLKPTFTSGLNKTSRYRRVLGTEGVQASVNERLTNGTWDRRERRRGGDRRLSALNNDRQVKRFDMRENSGRRKTDRNHPSIETEA